MTNLLTHNTGGYRELTIDEVLRRKAAIDGAMTCDSPVVPRNVSSEKNGRLVLNDDYYPLGNLDFSKASAERLALPDAVNYNPGFGGVLQSAREAALFRIAANDQDFADDYQLTRTAAIHFSMNGKMYVAFDDVADPSMNILLARADEGYAANRDGRYWLMSVDHFLVRAALDRAMASGRYVLSPDANERKLSLDGAYSRDDTVRAMLSDVAEDYEVFLRDMKEFDYGRVYDFTAAECKPRHVDSTTVNIRRVGIVDAISGSHLNANDPCTYAGRARRVRQKGSSPDGGAQ